MLLTGVVPFLQDVCAFWLNGCLLYLSFFVFFFFSFFYLFVVGFFVCVFRFVFCLFVFVCFVVIFDFLVVCFVLVKPISLTGSSRAFICIRVCKRRDCYLLLLLRGNQEFCEMWCLRDSLVVRAPDS